MIAIKNTKHQIQTSQTQKQSIDIKSKAKEIIDQVFSPEIDTSLVQKSVVKALSWDAQQAIHLIESWDIDIFEHLPKAMKNDSKVALAAIKKHPHIFELLSLDLKKHPEIKQQAIQSALLRWVSIIDIIDLVQSDAASKKTMKKYLIQKLNEKPDFFPDSMSKLVYEIYLSSPEIYTKIVSKWLIEPSLHWVTLWDRCISFLIKHTKNIQAESVSQSQELLQKLFSQFLEIPKLEKYPLLHALCQQIIQGLDIVQISPEQDDEDEQATKADSDWVTDSVDDNFLDNPDYYAHWPYSVAHIWNYCKVWDTSWKSMLIDHSSYVSMSDRSLENYMNFSLRMWALGLWFLLEKHTQAIQTATEINFFAGEWMSDSKILKFLNRIWKRLWVPESSYEDTDWNREVLCFQELGAAYFTFRGIAASWKVWKYNFDVSKRWSNTIVELYMKYVWIIDTDSWALSIAAFRDTQLDNE